MKYQKEFLEAINPIFDESISEEYKSEFLQNLIRIGGGEAEFERDIEIGISNGYSVEEQMKIIAAEAEKNKW